MKKLENPDIKYIESLKDDYDNTQAKNLFYDYALKYGVKLNKRKSFDNMLKDFTSVNINNVTNIEEGYSEIDDSQGQTVSDILDNLSNKEDEYGSKKVGGEADPKLPKIATKETDENDQDDLHRSNNSYNANNPNFQERFSQSEKDFQKNILENFTPIFSLIGQETQHYTMPTVISDYINNNINWLNELHELDQPNHNLYRFRNLIKSYAYYVIRDGHIIIKKDNGFIAIR